jgi:hypothetical protein
METGSVKPTETELLDALREAFARVEDTPDGVFTTQDLVQMTGRGEEKVRAQIRQLMGAGEAECIHVYRTAMDGRRTRVPAYRLKGPLAA